MCSRSLPLWRTGQTTLGAIAQRGAGTEAASAKAKADAASDRKELERLTTAISALQFTPTDADAVAAARSAVNAAERSRKAECGEGNAKQRGDKCRAREADEATARTALATAATNKAMTDQAAKLDTQAAAIRARLAKAPATPTPNALGEVLGGFLSISAASAATAQEALISAIVELVIAAALAMPELLRPVHKPTARREEPEPVPATQEVEAPTLEPGSVRRFMLACISRTKGEKVMRGAIYKRYLRWCDEEQPRAAPLPIPAFWGEFAPLCSKVEIKLRERDGKVYCLDVRLAA